MSGRGGRGRGGRGAGRGGRGRGRGHGYSGTTSTSKKGLCSALGSNIFDYSNKGAADQMRTSWEKLTQYVGTTYGQDISNELTNKAVVTIPEPTHTAAVLTRHAQREQMIRAAQANLQTARAQQLTLLEQAVQDGTDDQAPMRLAVLQNEIAQATFEAGNEIPIELTDSEKTQWSNEWRSYRERNAQLVKNRGQAFSLILGQCTQLLQDRMKQDTDWTTVSISYDPLQLYRLIEKTILAQTEDQYPFATVYDQEMAMYSFRQETMNNAQWYERFNTKVDVANAIGVTRQHKVLMEYVSDETHNAAYDTLTADQQQAVREDAEERYLSYVFLRQSGKQHSNLKMDLQNDFTTGDNRYPRNRQQTLHLLDKYSKTATPKATASEGTAFAQGGSNKGNGGQGKDGYDKKYWKDKDCFKCHKKGHPASHCPNKDDEDDNKSSSGGSVKKLNKDMKDIKKKFTTINAQLQQLNEDEELSDSDTEEEASHFQTGAVAFQFTQLSGDFDPRIAALFKQSSSKKPKHIDLREVILLDSQSTMDLICNPALVQEVFDSPTSMKIRSNGGTLTVNSKARLPGYHADVWFSKKAITNIVSLKNLIQQYRVTYDSDDLMFVVHRERDGKPNMQFRMHESGLHYFDPRDESFAFVNTVSDNKKNFTQRQIQRAEVARTLYARLSYPSMKDFKWIIRSNQIKDCPVTVQDIVVAEKIWGKDIAALKGKTTRRKPAPVVRDIVKVPREFMKLHKQVFLTADLFFVNVIPFFLTLSRVIYFTAVNHLADRTTDSLFKAFKEIYLYYLHRGFRITTVHADGEFEPLKPLIEALPGGPFVNLASRNEHVPEIERRIRVVKERVRAIRFSLPFSRIPKLMTIHAVFNAVKLLNFFPAKGGVSGSLSPKTIMTGETLDYKKHLSLQFGQYCQVHEEDQPRNGQAQRTRGAISLGSSGNTQGGHRFMALNSGKKITRYSWDVIPMPDSVIARVNALGADQPEQLVFTDRHGRPIGDNEITGVAPDYPVDDDSDDDAIPGVDADITEIPGVPDNVDLDIDINGNDGGPDELDPPPLDDDPAIAPDPELAPVTATEDPAATIVAPIEEPTTTAEERPSDTAEAPNLRRSTRTRKKPQTYQPSLSGSKYSYAVTQLETQNVINPDAHMFMQEEFYQADPEVVAMIMTQLSLKAGLREWGDRAKLAAHSEMKQLHMRDTFRPKHWSELTPMERKTVLESHMFLKEKRDGKVKGRTVAGGNKQRAYLPKEDASSPTVATESIMLSCIIDALEERDVAIIDIPNAFIQTRVKDEKDMVIIKIKGVLVDILIDIAPDVYAEYVYTDKRGVKCLLVQCLNAIYGTMPASLLYYRKFVKSLESTGFELNPYDRCVANKMIADNQMTICFHVDDCKLSHCDSSVVDDMVDWLRKEYESVFEDGSGKMQVSRGKVHTYLGMKLDYTVKGQVSISMVDYIDEILAAFDKAEPNGAGTKSSAAPEDLFQVDEDSKKLKPEKAVEFHNLVAKTLHATKRARGDTCTAIAFLTTRVREPNQDDWRKLVHLMKYLRGTRDLPLILSADGSGVLKWWVDASFAVHPNMRGHSGGGLSLGRGFPVTGSTKQKLNSRSSTVSEVIGVDDFMPSVCWTRYFMEAQGYHVKDNILYQDNKSAMLLAKNGKASSSKRTKHINIRYFFVTDRIAKGDLRVEWCPTADMIGDYMTKPLQGALFRKFRDLIMGVTIPTKPKSSK